MNPKAPNKTHMNKTNMNSKIQVQQKYRYQLTNTVLIKLVLVLLLHVDLRNLYQPLVSHRSSVGQDQQHHAVLHHVQ
jgi:hypothetical protein